MLYEFQDGYLPLHLERNTEKKKMSFSTETQKSSSWFPANATHTVWSSVDRVYVENLKVCVSKRAADQQHHPSLSFHVICWQEGKYNKNNSKLMWQQILISCHNRITSLLPAGSVRLQVSVMIRRLKCLDVQMLPAAVSLLTCLLRSGFTASWHLSRPQGEPSLDPISQTCC